MKKRNFRWVLGGALFLLLLLPVLVHNKPIEKETSRILIRFDDYGIWCNESWIEIEERLLHLHEKYNVKISWSVVPQSIYPVIYHEKSLSIYPHELAECSNSFPLLPGTKRVDVLKESLNKGISEVSMHGYYHPKFYSNIKNTEFFGVDYDTQFEKIKKGKTILDSLFAQNTCVFVPPHNTYDFLTLDALIEEGFTVISAKPYSNDAAFDDNLSIVSVPFTCDIFEKLYLKYQQNNGLQYSRAPIDILLLHHTSFTDSLGRLSEDKLSNYEEFLQYMSCHNITSLHFSDLKKMGLSNNNNSNRVRMYKIMSKISPSFAVKFLDFLKGVSYKNQCKFVFAYIFLVGFIFILLLMSFITFPCKRVVFVGSAINVLWAMICVYGYSYLSSFFY